MQILRVITRVVWCVATATAYQLCTNPIVLAALLALAGYWKVGAGLVAAWLLLCAVGVAASRDRFSPMAGREVFTTPRWLFLLGNEQEGNAPDWYRARHPKWPRWLCAFVFMAWRNKLRNLPFLPSLKWLHAPDPDELTTFDTWQVGGWKVELWYHGWLTELKYSKGDRFGDVGPRLDQPTEWGAVSWAYRLWGKN